MMVEYRLYYLSWLECADNMLEICCFKFPIQSLPLIQNVKCESVERVSYLYPLLHGIRKMNKFFSVHKRSWTSFLAIKNSQVS
jgi:hypothetical protein